MPMAAKGIPKLIEELGELAQICGKKLAYYTTDEHPDGTNLKNRMEEEMGDVLAAISFVTTRLGLDSDAIQVRKWRKLAQFFEWDDDPDNNINAIDGATS